MLQPPLPVFAQTPAPASTTPLTADQIAAIQAAVQTAIADVNPDLTGAARTQAVSQALAQVAATQITLNGAGALSPLIDAAISNGVPAPLAIAPIFPVATNMGIPAATAVNDITLGAISAGSSPTQTAEAIIAVGAQNSVSGNAVGSGLGAAAATLSASNTNASTQIAIVVANEGTLGTGQSFGSSVISTGGSAQLASLGQQSPNVANITGSVAATNTATTTTSTTVNNVTINTANTNTNNATINLGTGASQQISAIGTTITCTTPSCS